MKGFGIYVKNDLLDGKHLKNMGPAVWLYMWYLDKITAVNDNEIGKVLGGKPITVEMVRVELSTMTDRTYYRWVETLRAAGYINTLRTPSGLVITVNKADKQFRKKGSAKNGTSYQEKRDLPEMAEPKRDLPESVKRSAKKVNPNKTLIPLGINNTVTKVTKEVTKVTSAQAPVFEDGKPDPRNPEVQQLVDEFQGVMQLTMPSQHLQRRAAQTLLSQHGLESTVKVIGYLGYSRQFSDAPQILDLRDLREKWNALAEFYKRQHKPKSQGMGRSGVAVIA